MDQISSLNHEVYIRVDNEDKFPTNGAPAAMQMLGATRRVITNWKKKILVSSIELFIMNLRKIVFICSFDCFHYTVCCLSNPHFPVLTEQSQKLMVSPIFAGWFGGIQTFDSIQVVRWPKPTCHYTCSRSQQKCAISFLRQTESAEAESRARFMKLDTRAKIWRIHDHCKYLPLMLFGG